MKQAPLEIMQKILEKQAVDINTGICESYNICKYCNDKKKIFKKSDTPCAEAYILAIKNGVERFGTNHVTAKV